METSPYEFHFFYLEIDDKNTSALAPELPLSKDYYQVIWLRKGTLLLEIDFLEYELKHNTLIFIAPCQITKVKKSLDISAQLLKFTPEFFLSPLYNHHKLMRFPFFCPIDSSPLLKMNSLNTSKLEENMKSIVEEYQLGSQKSNELLSLYTYAFLINTQKLFRVEPRGRSSKHMDLVLDFKQLVDKNYRDVKLINKYADLLAVSPKYLNEACKTVLNSKANEVLSSRVILEAKRLLAYSNMGVSDVAWYLNFNDLSYFAKYFRKLSGQSPSHFKLEMENNTN